MFVIALLRHFSLRILQFNADDNPAAELPLAEREIAYDLTLITRGSTQTMRFFAPPLAKWENLDELFSMFISSAGAEVFKIEYYEDSHRIQHIQQLKRQKWGEGLPNTRCDACNSRNRLNETPVGLVSNDQTNDGLIEGPLQSRPSIRNSPRESHSTSCHRIICDRHNRSS
jgi:hypothetical protein